MNHAVGYHGLRVIRKEIRYAREKYFLLLNCSVKLLAGSLCKRLNEMNLNGVSQK